MRKTLAYLLVLCFLSATLPAALATDSCKVVSLDNFNTSASELTTDESHDLLFTVNVRTVGKGTADVYVRDDSGNVAAVLNDRGESGDKTACDGIYSANVQTGGESAGTVRYTAYADGIESKPQDVVYYHMMTSIELVRHEKFWQAAESYRQSLKQAGKTPSEVLRAMQIYVTADKNVETDTICYVNEYTFAFKFVWGSVGCIEEYALAEDSQRGTQNTSALTRAADEASWQNPDFMVFRPYRQSPYQGDFANEFYTDIAQSVCDITGGEMHDFQEQQAYPGNLKDIDRYGFFIIDSHGNEISGKSYMMMRKGDTSQYDYAADISAGHIIASGLDVGVTGSFFTKYIKDEGKTMPGTLLYLVVCYGMATDTICDPAFDCGAQLVFGYTDSVSFAWDFMFSETLWETFVSENPQHPERTYTFEESYNAAVRKNGSIDPYSVEGTSDRGFARPRMKGNTDFILRCDNASPVTDFNILNKSISLYTGETEKIEYQVISDGYTNYTVAFTSDDENVATVDEEGNVTVVSRADNSETVVTATLTDLADKQSPKTFTAVCTINGKGVLAVDGIRIENNDAVLYEGTEGIQIIAHVMPENATDKTLVYKSLNEDIVKVDENGRVTPVSEGYAVVEVKNPGSGKLDVFRCAVKSLTLTEAINAQGSQITVDCSEDCPFVPTVDAEGVPCAKSGNQKKDGTSSYIVIAGGDMKEGSYITFEWQVSSEQVYDKLCFFANDILIHSISGEQAWETYRYDVTEAGEYTFRIAYVKDGQMSASQDTGYVRNLELCRAGETHDVKFYDMDGKLLSHKANVEHGASVTPPVEVPMHEGYHFTGWSVNTDRVLSDLVVYAQYRPDATEPVHVILGDVNNDGKVNTADAAVVLKYSAEMLNLSDTQKQAADVNNDGIVNTADAVIILKFTAGMIDKF